MNLLLTENWDIFIDGTGQIATTPSTTYNIAQMVANEVKLFLGEGWYDRDQGIPHFAITFVANTNFGLVRQVILSHANAVEGVQNSNIDFYIDDDRVMHAVIYSTTIEGDVVNVAY